MYNHIELGKDPSEIKKALGRLIHSGAITLGGYKKAKIYGLLTCSSGKRMKTENRVFFRNDAEALANGYRPCSKCLPEKYKMWKAGTDNIARNGFTGAFVTPNFEISNIKTMKNSIVDYKKRADATVLIDTPGNIQLDKWEEEDSGMLIAYRFAASAFGEILIGATVKGVCYMGFTNGDRDKTLHDLRRRFPANPLEEKATEWVTEMVIQMNNPEKHLPVHLHLKGTNFQLSVWKKLLKIPVGGLTTYGKLGGHSKIARAVGTAVGSNPVCYILPCHRVIRGDGSFEGYFWGTELKQRLLTWEAAEAALVNRKFE